jgi:hypothetical protein
MKPTNLKTYLPRAFLLIAISSIPLKAQAAITTFSGQDDGAPVSGPFTNSVAAQTNFLSAANGFGSVATETFQEFSVGASGTLPIAGGSVTLTTPYGVPFGGVNSGTTGGNNLYGFPLPGQTNWLGFADGSAAFNFTAPTNSFGFFTTGVQTEFTTDLTITFNDGASETLHLPINVNGGASYFGFTDTQPFSSATITDLSNDAWGVSDVSYNFASTVPEPATWTMLILGFGVIGGMLRRSRNYEARAI